jgi:hypothetical protein
MHAINLSATAHGRRRRLQARHGFHDMGSVLTDHFKQIYWKFGSKTELTHFGRVTNHLQFCGSCEPENEGAKTPFFRVRSFECFNRFLVLSL